jgi:hypothetical protein
VISNSLILPRTPREIRYTPYYHDYVMNRNFESVNDDRTAYLIWLGKLVRIHSGDFDDHRMIFITNFRSGIRGHSDLCGNNRFALMAR